MEISKIEIEKVSVINVLKSVSAHLGGTFSESIDEAVMVLDNTNGKGIIKAFELVGGISSLIYDIEFAKEVVYQITETEERHLYFSYILKGYFEVKLGKKNTFYHLGRNQNIIIEVSPEHKTYVRLPKNVLIRFITINVDGNSNRVRSINTISTLKEELTCSFTSKMGYKKYSYFGDFSLNILAGVQELYELQSSGTCNRILFESIIHRILAYQLEEHKLGINELKRSGISKPDFEKYIKIAEYIETNLAEKHSVKDLASIAETSDKQLQIGFKRLFQKTVIKFINDLRLEKSQELIINTDMNITEIAYELGFASTSYYILCFKAKFNCTPKEYQRLWGNGHKFRLE